MPSLKHETHTYGDISLKICSLVDRQEFDEADVEAEQLGISSSQWSLFGVVWEAGDALAQFLGSEAVQDQRILEVGCGIGVTSLLLNRRGANITAMDYHPQAGQFLERNAQLNDDPVVPFVRASWNDDLPNLGAFDLIVGSDLLYEDEHPEQLSQFILRHLATPGRVLIADPGRGFRGRFAKKLEAAGLQYTAHKVGKVQIMEFLRSA